VTRLPAPTHAVRNLAFIRGLSIVLLFAAFPLACAERMGKNAAAGAMAQMKQQSERGGPPPASVAAGNVVAGAMAALDTPEQQARMQRFVSQTVADVTRSVVEGSSAELSRAIAAVTRSVVEDASAELVAQLGPNGSGPLAVSLSQTGERVSASVVGGVAGGVGNELAALVPECRGPNRAACLEQRLQQTTRTTAATFTKGVRDSLGWQLLFVAFVLGVLGGALGSWLWSLRQVRRSWRTA
jgi:hypothetical protein